MKNTPIPSYDCYGELLPDSYRHRRGQNYFPPFLIESEIKAIQEKREKKKKHRRLSLKSRSTDRNRLEEASFPHSYYVV